MRREVGRGHVGGDVFGDDLVIRDWTFFSQLFLFGEVQYQFYMFRQGFFDALAEGQTFGECDMFDT
jgi:hypothetical protein